MKKSEAVKSLKELNKIITEHAAFMYDFTAIKLREKVSEILRIIEDEK